MKNILIPLFAFLSGCATIVEHNTRLPHPEPRQVQISVHKMTGGDPKVLAYAEISGDTCKIYLRRYPQCLLHEVRHCFEGNWHEGRKTDESC